MEILTIGSSNRSWEEFLSLLIRHRVGEIVDVRRFPASRFPHFTKERLATSLKEKGINYLYLGDSLGGFRKGGYEAYMQSESFTQGLKRLEKEALERRVAVMCSERFAWRCHRRLIARKLKERGWRVIHIVDEHRTWEDKNKSDYKN